MTEKELEQLIKESEQKTETSFESLKNAARDAGKIGRDATETERRIELKRARRGVLLSIVRPTLISLAVFFGSYYICELLNWDISHFIIVGIVWLSIPIVGIYLSFRRWLNSEEKVQEVRSNYNSKVDKAEVLQNELNRVLDSNSSPNSRGDNND